MRREETIALIAAEMLKGKSAEQIAAFHAKDTDKQYNAVMNWRRKQKKLKTTPVRAEKVQEKAPQDGTEFIRQLAKMNEALKKLPLTLEEIEGVEEVIGDINDSLMTLKSAAKRAEIESLMRQRAEIEARLAQLQNTYYNYGTYVDEPQVTEPQPEPEPAPEPAPEPEPEPQPEPQPEPAPEPAPAPEPEEPNLFNFNV